VEQFPILYNGIKAAYPNMTLISTAYNEAATTFNYTIDLPKGSVWDTHHYEEPTFFIDSFDFWDNWQETTNNSDVEIFIGEYSAIQIDTPSGVVNYSFPVGEHIFYPELMGTVAEAVYLLGAERNPNTVKMTSYAPSLANLNSLNWTPNLFSFTADPRQTVLSVSYYSQLLLNGYRGAQTLPVTAVRGAFNPLFWVSTIDEAGKTVYLKVVNADNATVPLSVDMDARWSRVNGTIITNPDPAGFNYLNNQTAIVPVAIDGLCSDGGDGRFAWDVPAFSISVLQFDL